MELAGTLALLVVLSMIVEFVTDIIKKIIPLKAIGSVEVPLIISLIVGIVVALTTRANIFDGIGVVVDPIATAYIFTGIIISAGSKGVHELVSKLRESRKV